MEFCQSQRHTHSFTTRKKTRSADLPVHQKIKKHVHKGQERIYEGRLSLLLLSFYVHTHSWPYKEADSVRCSQPTLFIDSLPPPICSLLQSLFSLLRSICSLLRPFISYSVYSQPLQSRVQRIPLAVPYHVLLVILDSKQNSLNSALESWRSN